MERVIALIEPHYPKGEGGRPAYPLMAMLRVHPMQNGFGYSDPRWRKRFTSGLVHRVVVKVANVVDVTQVDKRLHGEESVVCADTVYTGFEKRQEHAGRQIIWQIAAWRSSYKKHGKRSALYKAIRKIEKAKAQVRAKVEHPFRVIKRQLGYTKVRFRALDQEHRSEGDAVCTVKPVDGAPTSTGERGRGTSVIQGMATARCSQRRKVRTQQRF